MKALVSVSLIIFLSQAGFSQTNVFPDSGNVGIGTTSPTALLTFPSLQALETYIQQYHHLPEIPSTGKMQSDGTDVGEFQTKLLQKIEELTLYIIKQDKRIEELERKIYNQTSYTAEKDENRQILNDFINKKL